MITNWCARACAASWNPRMISRLLAEAGSGRDAVSLCREHKPDLALLDFAMPDLDGIEATRQIVAEKLGTRILILTMHDNEEYAIRLIQAGASGFILKGTSPDEMIAAIRKVASGKTYITPLHHGGHDLPHVPGRRGQPAHPALGPRTPGAHPPGPRPHQQGNFR